MQKTVVIDIVGLSESILGQHTPFLDGYISGKKKSKIKPPFPAVTTTSQSVYLTGKYPSSHGIVGNGWYDKIDSEVKFWKQSNKLVGDEKIWDAGHKKDPNFTCANLFWWYNMYSCLLYTSPSPRDTERSRMPSSA